MSGEIRPIALVTDNGPCFKSVRFAAYIEKRPELIHIRTRRKSPNQNGVRERAFGSLKYEHLYRLEIDDGHQLGQEVETYRQLFNQPKASDTLLWWSTNSFSVRPGTPKPVGHLDFRRPPQRWQKRFSGAFERPHLRQACAPGRRLHNVMSG